MTPFYYSEKLFRSKRINHTEISSPPIFIIGHYRSGTTFIHKLLSCDQRWAKIKTFDFLFPYYPSWLGRIMKPVFQFIINTIKLKNPHFNNYLLDLDDPMEEDMVTIGTFSPYSAFWGELFPKNFKKILSRELTLSSQDDKKNWQETYLYLLKKITLKNDEKRLLLKNPPNTGRVQHLLELFPDAKFVFIYRNPYRVYYSTLNLWKNLLEKMYALQKITDQERDENIFFHYKFVMEKYLKEKVHIPPGNLIEIKYENLKKNPFLEIQSIYEQLNLGEFDNVKPVLDKLLSKEKKIFNVSLQL